MREREKCFEYPPRLLIKCEQIDDSKPLSSSFVISKRSKNKEIPIAQFSLVNQVSGNYIHSYIHSWLVISNYNSSSAAVTGVFP